MHRAPVIALVVVGVWTSGTSAVEAGCVALEPDHLPEVVRSLELGATSPASVREAFAGAGVEIAEKWDRELGGDDELVVAGLTSMTPNHGVHYGEITVRRGAANRGEYLQLRFRFTNPGGRQPVLFAIQATTRTDHQPSVCDAARPLADRLAEQKRPKVPPNLPPPRSKESRFTFYPCAADGRTVIVRCDDGNVKITFDDRQYPMRTVEYELLVGG